MSTHPVSDQAVPGVAVAFADLEIEPVVMTGQRKAVSPGPGSDYTLTKAELAEMLYTRIGLNKREAKDLVETFFDEIRTALERGESVKLSGFGNFQVRKKSQRPGRNPKTGQMIPIAARNVVTFHASPKLKETVDKGSDQ